MPGSAEDSAMIARFEFCGKLKKVSWEGASAGAACSASVTGPLVASLPGRLLSQAATSNETLAVLSNLLANRLLDLIISSLPGEAEASELCPAVVKSLTNTWAMRQYFQGIP